jgi:hypothetical protein
MKDKRRALNVVVGRLLEIWGGFGSWLMNSRKQQVALELAETDHFFRHIKKSWMDGDFIDPAAFRLRLDKNEKGLSVNWVEYFKKSNPRDAITPLLEIFARKGRNAGGQSIFAMFNVGQAKTAAAKYVPIEIVPKPEDDDESHAEMIGYEGYNDQVAEELAKVILEKFPAKS